MMNVDRDTVNTNVRDVETFGDQHLWECICKAWSEEEGWIKSTKAMYVGVGCIVQVTVERRNPDGSYSLAEAVAFVPGVKIAELGNGGHKFLKDAYIDKRDKVLCTCHSQG